MKTKQVVIAMVILACVAGPLMAKGGNGNGNGGGSTPVLTDKEASDLTFLREEEKLARDVYLAMAALYPEAQIFINISSSEQRHMDAVKSLLDKYGVTDPVVDDTPGVFVNTFLAETYAQLIAQGEQSLEEALKVGVAIEELDIHDIEVEMLPDAVQTDVKRVLANLLAGSYNHLDAFTKALAALPAE